MSSAALWTFGVVFAALFGVWFGLEVHILQTDPLWTGVPPETGNLWIPGIAFVLFLASQALLCGGRARWRVSPGGHAFVASAVWVLLLLLAGRPVTITMQFVAFALLALATGEGGRWLLERMRVASPPLWLGFVTALAGLQYLWFAIAELGALSPFVVFASVAIFAGLGLLRVLGLGRRHPAFSLHRLQLDRASGTLLFAIVLVLGYGYMASTIPQTYTDGLVYRLPYLAQIAEHGALPQHHELWAWLIPQPAVLQMVPGYLALGELGAAWTVFTFGVALALLCHSFARELADSRSLAMFVTLVVVSLPQTWLLTTVIYNDVAIAVYSLAGLFVVRRGLRPEMGAELVLGAALLGFAASIKVNAPVLLVLALLLLLICSPGARRRLLTRESARALLAAIVCAAPWYVWTFVRTGNPFFPFLNDLFPTVFETATIFTDEARSEFGFRPSVLGYLRFPYDLTFETSRFGSHPRGSFGPWLWCFLPLLCWAVVHVWRSGGLKVERTRHAAAFCLAPMLAFFLMSAFLGVAVFRYSLTGYLLFVIGASGFFAGLAPRVRADFAGFVACVSVGFLLLVGVRIHYSIPGGVGSEIYRGERSRSEFLDSQTHAIPEFVNRRIAPDETVVTSSFFFVHLFDVHAYHLPTRESLLGKVENLDEVRRFLTDKNVRYWVVNEALPPEYLVREGLFEKLLTEDRIVYGGGSYAVYDLRAKPPVLDRLELGRGAWQQGGRPASSPVVVTSAPGHHATRELQLRSGASFLRGALQVTASEPGATAIVDLVFRDEQGRELGRSVASKQLGRGTRRLGFHARVPQGTRSLLLIARAWRPSDGSLELGSGQVQLLGS